LGRGSREDEPETVSGGRGRRRSQCLSLLPSCAVPFRSRFASPTPQARILSRVTYR
jgi:hypothetical protein